MPGKPPPPPRDKPVGTYHRPRRVVEEYDDTHTPPSLKRADLPPAPSHPEHAPPVRVDREADMPSTFKIPIPSWVKLGGPRAVYIFAWSVLVGVAFKGANELLTTWNRPIRTAQDVELRNELKRCTKSQEAVVRWLRREHEQSTRQHEVFGAMICKLNGGPPHPTFPCGERNATDPDFYVQWITEPLEWDNRLGSTYQMRTSFPILYWDTELKPPSALVLEPGE